jgi:hypothetical protein
MKKVLSIIFILLLGINVSQAQNFSPDRPGIANGSFITPQNMLGYEAGIQFYHDFFITELHVGELLLRYGVSEKIELRATLGSFASTSKVGIGGNSEYSGTKDMAFGTKINLVSGNETPNLSALAEVSLPFGSPEYTNDEYVPTFALLLDQYLDKGIALTSNLGYTFGVGDLTDHWLFTLTPGFSITENTAGYAGYAGMYYGNDINQHWVEGGITFGFSSGAQLDLNLGLETEGESFFIGAGFAMGY